MKFCYKSAVFTQQAARYPVYDWSWMDSEDSGELLKEWSQEDHRHVHVC